MRSALILLILSCIPAFAAPIEGRASVIDRDTLAVEGTGPRIRLDAIDAPESGQLCVDAAGAKYLCGTKMIYAGLKYEQMISDLIAFLKQFGCQGEKEIELSAKGRSCLRARKSPVGMGDKAVHIATLTQADRHVLMAPRW